MLSDSNNPTHQCSNLRVMKNSSEKIYFRKERMLGHFSGFTLSTCQMVAILFTLVTNERLKLPNFLVVLADKQRRWVISWLLPLQVYHLTITKHWTASFITEFLNARIFVRASNFFRYQLHGSWIFLDYVGRVLKILVTFLPNLPTRSPL